MSVQGVSNNSSELIRYFHSGSDELAEYPYRHIPTRESAYIDKAKAAGAETPEQIKESVEALKQKDIKIAAEKRAALIASQSPAKDTFETAAQQTAKKSGNAFVNAVKSHKILAAIVTLLTAAAGFGVYKTQQNQQKEQV